LREWRSLFPGAATQSLRYTVSDPLLEQIGRAILAEMRTETAAGSLLVESLCSSLSARLLQSHSTVPRTEITLST
jgi:AraC family transcriptional regulator